jgi:hypothetical protein
LHPQLLENALAGTMKYEPGGADRFRRRFVPP